ncbi:MAG: hypothetical protein COT84_05000 [Chlamydiae bacterium CG10_big_fil_rev_8_21_14_0_10_35_9]|nr:MAG: hypothetical protein COT84_05000 [Chlamydiae bacterium CG10_big_fil_rev_8_21_14_0_10_35_9]
MMQQKNFSHTALNLAGAKKLVYTAMSKHLFYYRMHISKFVLEQNKVPLNPFMIFDYFLLDTIERDSVRDANNSIVLRSDEIWVFGPISNGVLSEILIAQKAGKPIRYFQIEKPHNIIQADMANIEMEKDVEEYRHLIFSEKTLQN